VIELNKVKKAINISSAVDEVIHFMQILYTELV